MSIIIALALSGMFFDKDLEDWESRIEARRWNEICWALVRNENQFDNLMKERWLIAGHMGRMVDAE